MSNIALQGVFEPADMRIIQHAFDSVAAEPWFSKGVGYREDFARYVMRMYQRGMVLPDRLESLCRVAAWNKYRSAKSNFEGYRFLIVEDEYVTAREANDVLTELGADVVGPVPRIAEAIDIIEHGPQLDGAILDINLGGERVYPVAANLKMKGIPFVFVTAYEDRVLPASFRSAKVFTKPASWASIASHVAHQRDVGMPPYPAERSIGA
ncbi:hypothetical protein AS026_26765 [Rhizobium altiplani]|uniref:Response regulatory domain-containing protein n=1 Tax=Rhizobium altiplani TaxID=1864509 RepID=A0A120FDU6_9HYPH|nr:MULTISPECIES: response regulator [Rhizobium]KWV40204.1 hypothetical protein AS026_26765 [Rhizobium altiplani]MDQ0561145.1 CheY-like chemotaxis protein [Rhizobium mesoamericanum]